MSKKVIREDDANKYPTNCSEKNLRKPSYSSPWDTPPLLINQPFSSSSTKAKVTKLSLEYGTNGLFRRKYWRLI